MLLHNFVFLTLHIFVVFGLSGLDLIYDWRQLDYNFPTFTARDAAIKSGQFVRINCVPIDVAVDYQGNFLITNLSTDLDLPFRFKIEIVYNRSEILNWRSCQPRMDQQQRLDDPTLSRLLLAFISRQELRWHNFGSSCGD